MTDDSTIPARVNELIRASIHSLEELEALVLLRKGRARAWRADQIAGELNVPEPLAMGALCALVANGLAERLDSVSPPCFRYLAADRERQGAVEELVGVYAQNRVPLLMRISSNAIERVREGALKTFSDAFRGSPRRRHD